MDGLRIWTVGHSNHEAGVLVALLIGAGIEVVADVRSQPYSRFSPQFNQDLLRAALGNQGIGYVFLGRELGGRPPEPHFYDVDGHVLYDELARSRRFLDGLRRLTDGAGRFRVAMLCSEEDPTNCHRRRLITRVFTGDGMNVDHIRGDGAIVTEAELTALEQGPCQDDLFGEEGARWRSTRSVSRGTAQRTSSRA